MSHPSSSDHAATDDVSTQLLQHNFSDQGGPVAMLRKTIAWLYDFLAEDLILLLGTAAAIAVAVVAVHVAPSLAGYVLYAGIVLVIATSLWRASR